ncbi:MAG: hypothetical protein HC817_14835 [Saprospiraceae bacterium]|nr:hypothetical protein [Saprospiraceae bacterium]
MKIFLYNLPRLAALLRYGLLQVYLLVLMVSQSYAHEASGQLNLDQRISLQVEEKPLKKVLAQIEKWLMFGLFLAQN